jgi:hypothetical protein
MKFQRVLRLLPPLKTGRHDIAEILLKVALNTKNQIKSFVQLSLCRHAAVVSSFTLHITLLFIYSLSSIMLSFITFCVNYIFYQLIQHNITIFNYL